MPPRVGAPSALASAVLTEASSRQLAPASSSFCRAFSSSTPCRARKLTKARHLFEEWLRSPDAKKIQDARQPQYIGPFADQPFPLNPLFRSQPVLSDYSRNVIWNRVIVNGETLKAVSADLGVDLRRVAAVVRLKQLEKEWEQQGKQLARPYGKAILRILPTKDVANGGQPHEEINEIPVHPRTTQQLFVPVSESRVFTREDAAKAFHEDLRSVDAQSPHRQLIRMERDLQKGKSKAKSREAFEQATQDEEDGFARKLEIARQREEAKTVRFKTPRFEFRIKDIDSETVGVDGKSSKGTGWRYGVPFEDRKKGMVKIPTSVPAEQ